MRRILAFVPMLALLVASGVIVLAVRAPRTWADHWTAPALVTSGAGQDEYGAVPLPTGKWDLLWRDVARSEIVYTHGPSGRTFGVDGGDVLQPDLARVSGGEFGVWVHNYNGSTALDAAMFAGGRLTRAVRLVDTRSVIEHPRVIAGPRGYAFVLFEWQRPNYDLFLARVSLVTARIVRMVRLTNAEYYSFYPKATVDGSGHIVTLHLESCCRQKNWNIQLSRFDSDGRRLGSPTLIARIQQNGGAGQWGEDLQTDAAGNVWGAVTGDQGIFLFEVSASGRMLVRPRLIDALGGQPASLALALGRSARYIFWEQTALDGSWLVAASFDQQGRIARSERAVYEGGFQANPHATGLGAAAEALWQNTIVGVETDFQMSQYRAQVKPNLAQRLGLGVGNVWEDSGVLVGGTIAIATITVAANVLDVFVIIAAGILFITLFRRLRARWILCATLLTGLLFLLFVNPGGPLFFLTTLPVCGLPILPYGVLAALAAFSLIVWASSTILNHIDDVYRVGVMACIGVFFFAFVEAVTLIEGQIASLG